MNNKTRTTFAIAVAFLSIALPGSIRAAAADGAAIRPIPIPITKPKHSMPAFGGTLLGFNGGEWGGALVFVDAHGRKTGLVDDNVQGIARVGQQILVFTGLAHMGLNRGRLLEVTAGADGMPAVRELAALHGAPSKVAQVDEDTVGFLLYSGKFEGNKPVYLCKALSRGGIVDSGACTADAGK
jgi:hypothetical protein